jgi:signal peptidase II
MSARTPLLLGLATACIAVALDQLTKAAVSAELPLYETIPVIGEVVRITHTRNPGIAFGISFGMMNGWFLTALTACGVAAIAVYLIRQRSQGIGKMIMLGLILGGAVGNLIDRFRLGEVVDFLDIGVAGYRWPVFNIADSVVVIGVGLLLLVDRRTSDLGRAASYRDPDGRRGG